MSFESITIKDIAKALGVGMSTVSRALRDSHQISESTKKRILEYATKMNYSPNPIALSLRNKRNKSIGLVISQIDNSFCSQVINGIESVAHAKGYQISIVQTQEFYQKEIDAIKYLATRVDGILISLSSQTSDISHLQGLHAKGMPIVFYDRISNDLATHKVISDNYKGSYDATVHLIENGYKKIAFIGGAKGLTIVQERLKGYMSALQDHQIPIEKTLIKFCPLGGTKFSETQKALDSLLQLKKPPKAVVCGWDKITSDCYKYCRERNLKMPEGLALIGFSNMPLTDYFSPALSIIKQRATEIGVKSAELLINLLESKRPPESFDTVILPPQLVIRETSQPLHNSPQ